MCLISYLRPLMDQCRNDPTLRIRWTSFRTLRHLDELHFKRLLHSNLSFCSTTRHWCLSAVRILWCIAVTTDAFVHDCNRMLIHYQAAHSHFCWSLLPLRYHLLFFLAYRCSSFIEHLMGKRDHRQLRIVRLWLFFGLFGQLQLILLLLIVVPNDYLLIIIVFIRWWNYLLVIIYVLRFTASINRLPSLFANFKYQITIGSGC